MAAFANLRTELMVLGHRFEFIDQHHYLRLPCVEKDTVPEPISDVRVALVLLFELYNDGTRRRLLTKDNFRNRHEIPLVRVETFYNDGGHAGDHDFPIAEAVLDELKREGCLHGTPHMGYTDKTELKLSDAGVELLAKRLESLASEEEPVT